MNSEQPREPEVVWGPDVRGWVSLVLFAHLFAVLVAVTTYNARPSELQDRLHELFAPYLRFLHLTAYPVSYPFARFNLTHGLPTDVDFLMIFDVADAAGDPASISIPPENLQPLIRHRRYQALANAAGTLAGDEDAGNILPRAIGGGLLHQRSAKDATVRIRAHYLPEMATLGESEPRRRQALSNFSDIYEARVFTSEGVVELLKKSTKQEVAPVEDKSNRGTKTVP